MRSAERAQSLGEVSTLQRDADAVLDSIATESVCGFP